MRNARKLAAVAAAGTLAAGIAVAATTQAHAATGPFSITSAASPTLGWDEGAPWTDGTTFTPVTVQATSGYGELIAADGTCLTLSGTTIVSARCTATAAQEWQSATHSGLLLWWNKSAPGACKFGTGSTQQVITDKNGALGVACPPTTGPAWPYTTAQEWTLSPPQAPSPSPSPSGTPSPSPSPDPSPSSSPPPSPPTVSCTTPGVIDPAPDVPNGHTGALVTNLTGAQIVNAYDASQTMFDGSHTNADPPSTDSAGDAVLSTNGNTNDQAMLSSCPFTGPGTVYTHGTFEARLNLPDGGNGTIANWPAFWLSGMNCRSDTAQPVATATEPGCWPVGGEFDVMESGPFSGFHQQADYHWNLGGGNDGTQAGTNDPTVKPGWHTFDAQWGPGFVAVYIDGALSWSYTSSNVESDTPLQVIFDMAGTGSGSSSTLLVAYLRVWAWQ